ncbi:MAG TPA: hypothetical protein VIF83_14300 [Gemmatimonadaceae bacterium]|jgi:hypothetical protein
MKSFVTAAVCVAVSANVVAAQSVNVEALADLEMWKTDTGSILLARNHGRMAPQAKVHAWVVVSPVRNLEIVTIGEGVAGYVEDERTEIELEMMEARLRVGTGLVLNAGKILSPIGKFGARRFSNVNPLIGEPDLYPTQYPWGAIASGSVGRFDYRAGAMSLPSVNERYTPEPGDQMRPVVGAGVRVGPAMHVGASFTHGPYLGPTSAAMLPTGSSWKDFDQTVFSADARVSVGYIESRLEAAWSSYEVPTLSKPVHGFGWNDETRVTMTPRIFAAGRFEHFRYAYVGAFPPNYWIGAETVQRNVEVGLGYRLSEPALLKVSYRRDFWPGVPGPGAPPMPDGSALAVQLSYHLDVSGMLSRKQ